MATYRWRSHNYLHVFLPKGLGRNGGTAVGTEVLPDSLPGSREPGDSAPGVCDGIGQCMVPFCAELIGLGFTRCLQSECISGKVI